jgi:hypothetical protein
MVEVLKVMKNITRAILNVSLAVENIEKSMVVGSGLYAYKAVSDQMVRNMLRPAMEKEGLSILTTKVVPTVTVERWEEQGKSRQSSFTEVVTEYLLIHSPSGESLTLMGYGHGVDTQDKGAGKATTYALKNTLLDLFLLTKGEDFDTDKTHSSDMDVPKTAFKPSGGYVSPGTSASVPTTSNYRQKGSVQ